MSDDSYNEGYEDFDDDPAAFNDYETREEFDEDEYVNGYEDGCEEGYESGYEEGSGSAEEENQKKHTDTSSPASDPHRFLYGAAGLAAGYAAAKKAGAPHRPPERRKPRILVNPSYTRYPEKGKSKLEENLELCFGTIVLIALGFLLFSC